MSPQKIRLIAGSVKQSKSPEEAIAYLELAPQKAALVLAKVLKTAIANARNNLKTEGTLKIKDVQIGEGPTYKRGIAVSRGRFHAIQKKTSHITVVLESSTPETTQKSETRNTKSQTTKRSKK